MNFDRDVVEVIIDNNMASKHWQELLVYVYAAVQFSQLDKDQLLYHEVYVHTATQLNGKKQENLKSLNRCTGHHRTQKVQKAELVTHQ